MGRKEPVTKLRKHIIPYLIFLSIIVPLMGLTACGSGGGGDGGGQSATAPEFEGGPSVAAKTIDIPAGDPRCAAGGIEIHVGIDENVNGILDDDEVDEIKVVCHGVVGSSGRTALIKQSNEPTGANCPNGGLRVESGIDGDNSSVLEDAEISNTFFVCNGIDGAKGDDGSDGRTGLSAIIVQTTEPMGSNCVNGGIRIDAGQDSNDNGILDTGEILEVSYVCNGGNGADGADGADGLAVVLDLITEPAGNNCTNGGVRIDSGLDLNGNSVLDASEVTETAYVCNGSDVTLDNQAPITALITPHGGEVWLGVQEIRWKTTDENPGTVEIRLSSDSGAGFKKVIAGSAPDSGVYKWDTKTVEDGANYRILIIPTDELKHVGNPAQTLFGDFTVDNTAPSLTLTSPAGGEIWNSSRNITWTTDDVSPGTVDILLSSDSGAHFATVIAAAPDTGTYLWDTTSTSDGSNYRIRVIPTDQAGITGASDETMTDFSIENTPPVSVLDVPIGGEIWAGLQTIRWSTKDINPGTVEIRLSSDSGKSFPTQIEPSAPDTGSYSWDSSGVVDGSNYRVRITATDAVGNTGMSTDSSADFTIDNTAPTIVANMPTDGQAVAGTQTISWTTTDENIDTVTVRLGRSDWNSGPPDYTPSTRSIGANDIADIGNFSWDTTVWQDHPGYYLHIIAKDAAGNLSSVVKISNLMIDNTPPAVMLYSPTGGELLDGMHQIHWTVGDALGSVVEIRLSNDSGASYPVIIASAISGFYYDWDTMNVADGSTYRIQVIATDGAGNVSAPAASQADFSIDNTTPPTVTGFARFSDENTNGIADAGDTVVVPFDRAVSVNQAFATDFMLPVMGDTLGTGATVATGPVTNEVTVTLGASPKLKTRGNFRQTNTQANSATGIDVSPVMGVDAIEYSSNGVDAVPSVPIDMLPSFVLGPTVGSYIHVTSLKLADLDSDGDLDMVSTSVYNWGLHQGSARVWFNDGAGNFSGGQTLGVPCDITTSYYCHYVYSAGVGDIDRDGDLDIVVGNGNGTSSVFVNDGAGGFTDTGQALGSTFEAVSHLIDLDSDGDLDLIGRMEVVRDVDYIMQVWLNDGTGTYTDGGNVEAGYRRSNFYYQLADMDNDGDPDLVTNDGSGLIKIWLNNGAAGFTDSSQIATDSIDYIWVADIDGDRDLDLFSQVVSSGVKAWLNNGVGVFTGGQTLASGGWDRIAALSDLDGDQDFDLILMPSTIQPDMSDQIWLNNGSGTFADSGKRLDITGASTLYMILRDLDGDGDIDIWRLSSLGGYGHSELWYNRGDTSFEKTGQDFSAVNIMPAFGDIDGDGDLDFVGGNYGGTPSILWYLNSLSGTWGAVGFTQSRQALGSQSTMAIAVTDMDGDGDMDLIEGNGASTPNRIRLNNGSGVFTDAGQALGNSGTTSLAVGDVDKDGDIDFVAGNGSFTADRVWLNNGSGIFTDSGQALGASSTAAIALGDVDKDGDLDLVVGNGSSTADQVWLNNGSGVFTDSGQALGAGSTAAIALGDIDKDGDLDLVTGNGGTQANRVWKNNGAGVFSDSGQALGANNTSSLALGDVDGDGDLDIMEGQAKALPNVLWLNDGSGQFTDAGHVLGANNTRAVLLIDIDKDGDLDLLEGNDKLESNRVWFNE